MRCEVCGNPVKGRPIETLIEGTTMKACPRCARFGKKQDAGRVGQTGSGGGARRNILYSREEKTIEFVDDAKGVIRRARESKSWTREELGQKINEKVSVISRLESGKMDPDKKLAKKLERTLGITLITEGEGPAEVKFESQGGAEVTLGDFIKVKKK